jgi:hypothetical protein
VQRLSRKHARHGLLDLTAPQGRQGRTASGRVRPSYASHARTEAILPSAPATGAATAACPATTTTQHRSKSRK